MFSLKPHRRQLDRRAPRGDDDVGGVKRLRRLGRGHFDGVVARKAGGAADVIDLVFLEEGCDSPVQRLNHRIFPRHHGRQIERNVAGLNAVAGEGGLGLVVQLAGIEQCLARNTPPVEAGAAQGGLFFDAADAHAQLGGADGGNVSAGAGADDDQIVSRFAHKGTEL